MFRRMFKSRIAKLMGAQLQTRDLSFLERDLAEPEIELLHKFTQIDTATLNKAGVAKAQALVTSVLQALGFVVRTVTGDNRFADLIIAERPGKNPNKFISLVTHTDTVLGNHRPFEIDGNTARGCGVIDNKGGVVVGLSALRRYLAAYPETEYSLRFICSPNEEMGSIGFTQMFRELGRDSVVGFGLEPALDNGSIIHQRRGNRWYDVTVTGHEAHSGRSYGEHANAAHDLASKVYQLSQLTNYKKHLSVNVGHIVGGKDRHNIICGQASVKLDVRFPSMEARDYLHKRIEKILSSPADPNLCGERGTVTKFAIVDDCPPFSLTRRSHNLAHMYAALVSKLEARKVFSQPAGGAGDVNYLSTPENFILDGLGPVGGEMHTGGEFLHVDTLATRSKALAGMLLHLQTMNLKV